MSGPPRPRRRQLLPVAALLALAACAAVEWQGLPEGVPARWRHLELRRADTAWVLAADGDAAAGAYRQVDEVVRTVREVAGADPGPGLAVVISRGDPPLLDDPEELARQLALWHGRATGLPEGSERGPALAPAGLPGGPGTAGAEADLDPGTVLRLAAAGVPLDDDVLGLPPALVKRVAWIVVMPSPECVEDVVDEMVDAAMAKAELSFFERLAAAPFLPAARGTAAEAVGKQVLLRLFEICLAAARVERDGALACLQRAGLLSDSTPWLEPAASAEPTPGEGPAGPFGIRELSLPLDGMPMVAVSATPAPEQLASSAQLGWTLLVDLRPDAERPGDALAEAARQSGIAYARVPVSGPSGLTRENAARLDAALDARPGFALVFSTRADLAAALLALRARWFGGASPHAALELGRHHGMGTLEPRVVRQLAGRGPE